MIHTQRLIKRFGDRAAHNDISLEVAKRNVVAIIGSYGSGSRRGYAG
ncbi:hypothetical protein [Lonsdalea quercina]